MNKVKRYYIEDVSPSVTEGARHWFKYAQTPEQALSQMDHGGVYAVCELTLTKYTVTRQPHIIEEVK